MNQEELFESIGVFSRASDLVFDGLIDRIAEKEPEELRRMATMVHRGDAVFEWRMTRGGQANGGIPSIRLLLIDADGQNEAEVFRFVPREQKSH